MLQLLLGTICLLISLMSNSAVAVEKAKVLERYSLVGVIAESTNDSNKQGIVVIRDNEANRNLTLRTGEMVSAFDQLKVAKVMRNKVQLISGTQKITISYAGSTTTPTAEVSSPDMDAMYVEQLNDLESRYISTDEIVHVYEDGVDETAVEIKADDSARLWKPVRTGDSLKYVIDMDSASELTDDAIEEIFEDEY